MSTVHGHDDSTAERSLEREFGDDHRVLTRGLVAIEQAARDGDWSRARAEARELDAAAGPHIRFEEEVFYPRLRQLLGEEFVDTLYDEHGEAQTVLRRLADPRPVTWSERDSILRSLALALDHVESCGTLLSHLAAVPDEERRELTERLRALRREPVSWTRIESPRPVHA